MNLQPWCAKIRLKGSEAQIKWATTLRKKRAEQFGKLSIRHMALAVKPHVTDKDMADMGIKTQWHLIQFLFAVAKYTLSCPDAAWWIRTRDDNWTNTLPDAIEACRSHFTQTKPFK